MIVTATKFCQKHLQTETEQIRMIGWTKLPCRPIIAEEAQSRSHPREHHRSHRYCLAVFREML